ncbi:A disintegrin and metalloproteinase with thrombospondin motifs 15-like [Oscarella lobularis]|uniref:A disintegrin and metalloproteinase with thrombospondin motifs 15-like n=1 Tax=Oscarella lobularis TaxID=121494 RepID=UPI00331398D6
MLHLSLIFVLFVFHSSPSRADETLDFIGLRRPKLVASPLAYRIDLGENRSESIILTVPLRRVNRLASAGVVVESRHRGDVTRQRTIDPSCLFIGESSHPFARAAVNLCDGLSAVVDTDDAQYLIRPLTGSATTASDGVHKVHRLRRAAPSRRRRTVLSTPNGGLAVAGRRATRGTVELGLVADRDLVDFYGNHTETYLLTIMNVVTSLYGDATVSDLVDVVLTRLILLQDDTLGLSVSRNADRALTDFCVWQRGINYQRGTRHHYDVAILLTRKDICDGNQDCDLLGLANIGSACESKRSCAVVQDVGFASSVAIAHELGHLLGMKHDDVACSQSPSNHVMSTSVSSTSWGDGNRARWSDCSRRYLIKFLDDGRGECLADVPLVENDHVSTHRGENVRGVLPGEIFASERAAQCRFLYGSRAKPCASHTHESRCHSLKCYVPGRSCTGVPLADYTPCGHEKHCFGGKCLRADAAARARVDGAWSSWSSYDTCTRTCGGGVQLSRRQCNNPRPQNGGRYCDGDSIRYKSCATKNCPRDAPSFRNVQCAEFDGDGDRTIKDATATWTAKHSAAKSDLCRLVCGRGSIVVVRASTVVDGTPCGFNGLGRCVQGQCLAAGCDNVIGSNKTTDRCGVCGGNSLNCKMVEGEMRPRQRGFVTVLDIPAGASEVEVKQVSSGYRDGCYLALQTEAGGYVFNGNFNIQMHKGVFSAAGTQVLYTGAGASQEMIKVNGPTSEKLTVKVLNLVLNPPEISYKFVMKKQNTIDDYQWKHNTTWSPCSKKCQGVKTQKVRCVLVSSGEAVDDGNCTGLAKLEPRTQPCNTPCPAKWFIGKFSSCSSSCGRGVMTRNVVCVQNQQSVSNSLCAEEKPSTSMECNSGPCPTWKAGLWKQCTGFCFDAIQSRTLQCVSNSGRVVSTESCSAREKPALVRPCKAACPRWQTEDWGQCSKSCGSGVQNRAVKCLDDDTRQLLSDDSCAKLNKPETVRQCLIRECAAWEVGNWTQCSSVCDGTQSRPVQCVGVNRDRVASSHCAGVKRPLHARRCSRVDGGCSGAHWSKTKWSTCNTACGKGEKSRHVFCSNGLGNKLPDNVCKGRRPILVRSCRGKSCGTWKLGAWEDCSATCGIGVRLRSVKCVLPDGREVKSCLSKRPVDSKRCKKAACPTSENANVNGKSANACEDKDSYCATYVSSSRQFCFIEGFRRKCCHSCRVVS